MENALRACCKGIKIGKILFHRIGDNGQQVSFRRIYWFPGKVNGFFFQFVVL
jgi:hypothetical protein